MAAAFLRERGLVAGPGPELETRVGRILGNSLTHLKLTGIALLLACAIAIPVALLLSRFDRPARALLYISGLVNELTRAGLGVRQMENLSSGSCLLTPHRKLLPTS